MMILIGIIVGVISLFVPLVIEQGKNLSLLEVDSFKENILFLYAELSNYLSSYGFSLDNSIFNVNWLNNIDFTFLPEILNSIGKTLGNLTIGILSVMFISFSLESFKKKKEINITDKIPIVKFPNVLPIEFKI